MALGVTMCEGLLPLVVAFEGSNLDLIDSGMFLAMVVIAVISTAMTGTL